MKKDFSGDRKSEFGHNEEDDSKKDDPVLEIQTQILQKETSVHETKTLYSATAGAGVLSFPPPVSLDTIGSFKHEN